MPKTGVASQFMDLLGAEQATAGRRAMTLLVIVALLAGPAFLIASAADGELLQDTRLGLFGIAIHVMAAVAGLIVGNLVTRRRVKEYESSLRGTWKAWMRWSTASETVPDIHRRVQGKASRNLPWWTAALLTLLWALEVGLLALAFANAGELGFAIPVIALNAIVPAMFAAHYLRLKGWVRELEESLSDLVRDGELGVWGVL